MIDKNIFVVRSNDNEYLYQDQNGNLGRMLYRYYGKEDAQRAIERAGHTNQCHVVELADKPAPEVVSEDEAKALKEVMDGQKTLFGLILGTTQSNYDRSMRAYVNGWTVEKPKRWNVKVPLVAHYIYRVDDGELNIEPDSVGSLSAQFTTAEIEHYGLQDYEKVEVSDKGEQNE